MNVDAILIGGFHEILELCSDAGVNVVGIIDDKLEGEYYGIPIIGKDGDAMSLREKYGDIPVIITPDSPSARKRLAGYYRECGFRFMTLISPYSKISKYSSIGEGSIVQSGVNVSAGTHVGAFSKLNIGSNLMHDNRIGDFVTFAPEALSLGRVTVGDGVYVGAHSTILPDIKVGEDSIVGAGAVVTKDVPEGVIVKGILAR